MQTRPFGRRGLPVSPFDPLKALAAAEASRSVPATKSDIDNLKSEISELKALVMKAVPHVA